MTNVRQFPDVIDGVRVKRSNQRLAADYLIQEIEAAIQLAKERAASRREGEFESRLQAQIDGREFVSPAPTITYHEWQVDGIVYGGFNVED